MSMLAGALLKQMVACAILSTAFSSAEVPERSLGGQTLDVPQDHLDLGSIYYVSPGGDPQLMLTSKALLQRLVITTRRVVGYLVTPFDLDEEGPPVLGGAFRIPVVSLKTGLDDTFNTPGGGDHILHGPQVLDRDNFPEILFRIIAASDLERTRHSEESTSYDLKLQGELTVKGNTTKMEIPASITFMPSTFRTMARLDGDLLLLESSLTIEPGDFGWKIPSQEYADRIAEELQVELYLLMTTVSPDKSLDPLRDPSLYAKQLRFITLLRDLQDPDAGYAFGRSFMAEIWDRQEELQRLAEATLTTDGIGRRDLPFALKAARRANELSLEGDSRILATVARAHYEMGDLKMAVAWQQKAVARLDGKDERLADEIKTALVRYEKEAQWLNN